MFIERNVTFVSFTFRVNILYNDFMRSFKMGNVVSWEWLENNYKVEYVKIR